MPTLTGDQLAVIRPGSPEADGNAALIAPGTGLGETLLHKVGGRFVPAPSEAGHADFAARTGREADLARALIARFGRASYEQVISGPGLVNIHRFVHGDAGCGAVPPDTPAADQPALIARSGLERRCAGCVEALELFVGALGAEAGNLGLRSVATAGVYLGGGIPPKILPALRTPTFLDAFRSKAPMGALVDAMPIAVILEAARRAAGGRDSRAAALAGGVGLTATRFAPSRPERRAAPAHGQMVPNRKPRARSAGTSSAAASTA